MTASAQDGGHEVTGGCLCGAVRFRATLPDREVGACWCSQCRRQNSGPLIAVACATSWSIDGRVTTFRASDAATRGFCAVCGSTLYWQGDGQPVEFTLGALDHRDGYRLVRAIHPEGRPAFYDLEAAP